jgi:hypothetical protein
VPEPQPAAGLELIVGHLLLGRGAWVDDAVNTACALIVAGHDTPATIQVAALPFGTALSEAEGLIREMLREQGVSEPPEQPTDAERFAYVTESFGHGLLPFSTFYDQFYWNMPEWGKETPTQRRLMCLVEEWERETDPRLQDVIVQRIRDVIASGPDPT